VSGARERPLRVLWRSFALDPDSGLSMGARLAACAYTEYSTDDDGNLDYPPSATTLAGRMGCSARTAWSARKELVDSGLLELDERPGRTSGVRLVFPPSQDLPTTYANSAEVPSQQPSQRPRQNLPTELEELEGLEKPLGREPENDDDAHAAWLAQVTEYQRRQGA
jgi:hypothetical protein